MNDRLNLLFLSPFPPSPATFGAQRRVQGLIGAMARRHHVTTVAVVTTDYDPAAAGQAIREYCEDVLLVPARAWEGTAKRLLQLRSLFSARSFVRSLYDTPALRRALRPVLSARAYDVVTIEFPYLARVGLSLAPAGRRVPRLVLDEHNLEFDLARQQARGDTGPGRRLYNAINWRKVRQEEVEAWTRFDGVAFCSGADEEKARALAPSMRSVVVPNAVDVGYFRRPPAELRGDGRTVLFFGALNYFPNEDGVTWFLREIWPAIARNHPQARLKIVGQAPTAAIASSQGPRIEVTGPVPDLRPHLGSAAVTIAPLRIGGGTRFKILEALAMEKPVVSTSLGAEGIEAEPGRHLLLADDAAAFAEAVGRVLEDPALGERMGRQGRALVERRYSWDSAAQALEGLYRKILGAPPR